MIYFGIVESRDDPLKLGRCRVRVVGLHSHSRDDIPTESLPWAYPIQPIISAGISGVGYAPVGLVEGSWVCVTFKDKDQQIPLILGSIGGIPSDGSTDITTYQASNELSNITPVYLIESYSSEIIDKIKATTAFNETAVYVDSTDIEDGHYIIGYGSRVVEDIPVSQDQTITKDQAQIQLKNDLDSIFITLQGMIRAPVTQSMMDALVMLIHDIGFTSFNASSVLIEINTSKYTEAAASIQNLGVDSVSKRKRAIEKTLFLKDGVPTVDTTPQQTPMQQNTVSDAFMSPTGKYPLYKNEPDTNKLARHENVGSTVVPFKESARVTGVAIANGGTWDQPEIPYNADYPFNKVFASESGHLLEFDDTNGSERVHIYHKSGTFTEIDCNGTQVNRIVGDSFEILERNGNVYVKGALNVNVEGAHTLKVSGTTDVEINGKTTINIYNDAEVNISGNADVSVGETLRAKATSIRMEADSDFHLVSKGTMNIQSEALNILGTEVAMQGLATLNMMGTEVAMQGLTSLNILGTEVAMQGLTSLNILGTEVGVQSLSVLNLRGEVATLIDSAGAIDINTMGLLNMNYSAATFGISAAQAAPALPALPAIPAIPATPTFLLKPKARKSASSVNFSTLSVPTRTFREASTYETPDEGDSTQFVKQRIAGGTLKKSEAQPVKPSDAKEEKVTPKNVIQPPVQSCDIIFGMNDIPRNLQLSKNFNLLMLTKDGSRPVVNQMGLTKQQIVCNLKGLCENCLEPILEMYPNISISSGFRRPGDVAASAARSQHYNGEAVDIVFRGFSHKQVYDAISEIQAKVPYDQLLLEYEGSGTIWIHISFVYTGLRRQCFTMKNHSRVSPFGKFLLL